MERKYVMRSGECEWSPEDLPAPFRGTADGVCSLLTVFLLTIAPLAAAGQNGELAERLTTLGFEGVMVEKEQYHLFVGYENRVYRAEADGLAVVLQLVGEQLGDAQQVSVIAYQQGVPVTVIDSPGEALRALAGGAISWHSWLATAELRLERGEARRAFRGADARNPTPFKLDLPVGMGMRYQLGNREDPWRFAFDLEPEASLSLTTRTQLTARLALPFYNNFDANTYVRPVELMLTRRFRAPLNTFGSMHAGLLGRNRLGVHLSTRTFLHREVLSAGIQAGYTTFTSMAGEVFFTSIEDRNYAFMTGSIDFRWRPYDVNMTLTAGRFLYTDRGFRFDVARQFREAWIGIFYMTTLFGENAGFRVSVPLYPSSYARPGRVRVRPAEAFSLPYRFRGNDLRAREYIRSDPAANRLAELYPSTLRNRLMTFDNTYNH